MQRKHLGNIHKNREIGRKQLSLHNKHKWNKGKNRKITRLTESSQRQNIKDKQKD